MQLVTLETPGIAHYAYLLVDGGEAAIIDPRRDIDDYLLAARAQGARIRYVVETHRQEDFVMGSAYLAQRVGAQIVNGRHQIFAHGDLKLGDDDSFAVGRLTVRALQTPGHTPESMSYAIYTEQRDAEPWGVFTGDALFFGTTGRTDLTDGLTSTEAAAMLYDSVHDKLSPLGDTTLILPAHGPGSVCGSGMVELPRSTLGAEKRYNEVFVLDREAFARKKGGERIPRPPYFRHMEGINRRGGLPPARRPGEVPLLQAADFGRRLDGPILIDTREPEGFAGGHVSGAHSVWMGGLPVFGGWVATHESPTMLISEHDQEVEEAVLHLSRIGIDNIQGALQGGFGSWRKSGKPIASTGTTTPQRVHAELGATQVLDVREADEYATGHIPGALHAYVGDLPGALAQLELRREQPVVVTCSVGHRAGLAASILAREGFTSVFNLLGGMSAWRALELPTTPGDAP